MERPPGKGLRPPVHPAVRNWALPMITGWAWKWILVRLSQGNCRSAPAGITVRLTDTLIEARWGTTSRRTALGHADSWLWLLVSRVIWRGHGTQISSSTPVWTMLWKGLQMKLTFKSVDAEKSRLTYVVLVGLIQSDEGLKREPSEASWERGIVPADCLWTWAETQLFFGSPLCPADFGLASPHNHMR